MRVIVRRRGLSHIEPREVLGCFLVSLNITDLMARGGNLAGVREGIAEVGRRRGSGDEGRADRGGGEEREGDDGATHLEARTVGRT